MSIKKFLLIMLISIMLVACNQGPSSHRKVPTGKIVLNGQEYLMMYSVFEWKEKNIEMSRIRGKDNEQIAEEIETIAVTQEMKIVFDKEPISLTVFQQNE